MKSALTVVLFRLFTIGVFVDGNEVSNVSVMEGDSVTLKPGFTDVQKNDRIEWRFNGKRIDKFVDGLQRDSKTGDLKISNIRTTDSGLYKVKISSTRGSSVMEFNVNVLPTGAAKAVIVNEGDFITLRTDVPDIHRVDEIRWRFGLQKSPVAEINRMAGIFKIYDDPDERFRDRLTLNNQTGSLNITNISTIDSGLYEADISSGKHTIHKSFNVNVSDEVESVSVLEGDNVTLRTGLTEIQRDDEILWKFGDQDIADLNGPVNKKWSNIHLNNQTGDLNISNITSVQYGYYKVEIKTKRMVLHMKYHMNRTVYLDNQTGDLRIQNNGTEQSGLDLKTLNFTVSVVSGSGLSPGEIAVVVCVLVGVGVAAACVKHFCKKQQKRKYHKYDEEPPPNPTLLNGSGNGNENETEFD